MFGVCWDGECDDGHDTIREVTKCPIEPSNVPFKKVCTEGNVYGMSSSMEKSKELYRKVCEDTPSFKKQLATLTASEVTATQDCAKFCQERVSWDGTGSTGDADFTGVCSQDALDNLSNEAHRSQKRKQDALKLRTQIHNKEFNVRIDYADVHFRKSCMPQVPRLINELKNYVPRERWIDAVDAMYEKIDLKCHLRAYRYVNKQLQELTAHIVVKEGTFNEVTTKTDEKDASKFVFVLEPRGRPEYEVTRVECRVVDDDEAECNMEGLISHE